MHSGLAQRDHVAREDPECPAMLGEPGFVFLSTPHLPPPCGPQCRTDRRFSADPATLPLNMWADRTNRESEAMSIDLKLVVSLSPRDARVTPGHAASRLERIRAQLARDEYIVDLDKLAARIVGDPMRRRP